MFEVTTSLSEAFNRIQWPKGKEERQSMINITLLRNLKKNR
jgi:hypothetical protein